MNKKLSYKYYAKGSHKSVSFSTKTVIKYEDYLSFVQVGWFFFYNFIFFSFFKFYLN